VQNNIAAYLDEAGEDPLSACKTLTQHNIKHAILREAWSGNVCSMSDSGHGKLKSILSDYGIQTIMIASTLGKIDYRSLSTITDQQITDAMNICKYYRCNYLRIFVGEKDKFNNSVNMVMVDAWIRRVSEISLLNGIQCLYEITSDSTIFDAVETIKLIKDNNIGLIYDAAGLIIKHNFNPFIKHWPLLRNYTHIIDVRDLKIGQGFKVVGHGDSRIDMTINDAVDNKYKGWFAIEPSFGRKFGSATTKEDTFSYAVEGLLSVLGKSRVTI